MLSPSSCDQEEMTMRLLPLLALGGAMLVAACGSSQGDRALSGAALGAGAGLAVGAVTNATLLQGAVVGGALGAAAGALTDQGQVNLGKPAWRR
jgi:hypothetical protein